MQLAALPDGAQTLLVVAFIFWSVFSCVAMFCFGRVMAGERKNSFLSDRILPLMHSYIFVQLICRLFGDSLAELWILLSTHALGAAFLAGMIYEERKRVQSLEG